MGDEFYIVDTSFLTKKPEWDEDEPLKQDEYKKKKARRRSIQEGAPASLLTKLENKLVARNLPPIQKINLSDNLYWYRHDTGVPDTGVPNEELFSKSDIVIEGVSLEQTVYRAFLIKHYDIMTKTYDQKAMCQNWDDFAELLAKG